MWIFLRPDAKAVWRNNEVVKRLSWYKMVMEDRMPAKYRIVKRIPLEENIDGLDLSELWNIHSSLQKEFRRIFYKIRGGEIDLDELDIPDKSFLDLKIEIVYRMLSNCILCERRCKVDRLRGEKGVCGLDNVSRVSTYFHHLGEEAPLIPSGTIFFSGCSFKCVFCQNWDISQYPEAGEIVSPKKLAEISIKLRRSGAKNINYVGGNPDQHLHTIVESLKYMDINVPLLWNSNFYLSNESMNILIDLIDIWLPDFKYGNDRCALRLSSIPRYFEVITRNFKMICGGEDIIIRHLVLPNHIECCTKPILKWISENCPRALVNIMDQYRPEYLVARYPEKWSNIARRLYINEINEAYYIAEKYGICFKPVS